jgi:UDP-2-acetamido-3-amino-2,3-dideoxy-glucuronate N-acetyltransferase
VRGEHAHKACHQFLVCVKGSCTIVLDDGSVRDELRLDSAKVGLHIPPMVWGIQYRFSADAVLLVLASDTYDAADYIRNYDEFMAAVKAVEARA